MSIEQRQKKYRSLSNRARDLDLMESERLLCFLLGYCEQESPPKLIEALEAGLWRNEKTASALSASSAPSA